MRKTIAFFAILSAALASFYFSGCNNETSASQTDNREDSMKNVVARGEYLAVHVAACIHCHSLRDFSKFAGPTIPGTEGGGGEKFDHGVFDGIPGILYGKNITPDPETGIGTWSDEEVLKAITHGIRKNGDTLFPLMPYASFNAMAKDDLLSIIAYLRTLKPIKNQVPERQLMVPMSIAYPAPALKPSIEGNVRPAESDIVNYGGYLVTVAGCADCHTPFSKGQPDFSKVFGGGNLFTLPAFKVVASNITPDSATGIGSWNEKTFMAKFLNCRSESGYNFDPGKSNSVMPVVDYAGMTDADLRAIYTYMRTVKPVTNLVVKNQSN